MMYIVLSTTGLPTLPTPTSLHSSMEGAREAVRAWAVTNEGHLSISGDAAYAWSPTAYARIYPLEPDE